MAAPLPWRFILLILLLPGPSSDGRASLPSPFDGPSGQIPIRVKALGTGFETSWNRWFVLALRLRESSDAASRALADTLDQRLGLAALAEQDSLGTHISADALMLARTWTPEQRRSRIRAFEAESSAAATVGKGDLAAARSLYSEALQRYGAVGDR